MRVANPHGPARGAGGHARGDRQLIGLLLTTRFHLARRRLRNAGGVPGATLCVPFPANVLVLPRNTNARNSTTGSARKRW